MTNSARWTTHWIMPEWMRPYAHLITNTGREPTPESIEQLYNGTTRADINLPLAMVEAAVYSQVCLLEGLFRANLLKRVDKP